MNESADNPLPLLDGYRLIKKIGAGGYGEVWSAEAPGGLSKAIKYVFGGQLDKRATLEARALEKIRAVRHPFLLSLERIETVDDRLLIVTELADGSLRDRFRACVEDGMPGIPRDELIGYLHDAADALDFLSTQHDLAHLDIKPENLLLVAGHVKVADFGLVKNIGAQTQASLVGGMTPTYAAPEVFRGTPSRASDQYSLAILYQELLTGLLPFLGKNAAELTLQHMNHDPDLSPLSEEDRFVVSRALSKNGDHRYDSAADFVAALRNPDWNSDERPRASAHATPRRLSEPLAPETVDNRQGVTEIFDDESPAGRGDPSELLMHVAPLEEPTAVRVETPESGSTAPFRPTPALFIGIGGTGGRVLRALRGKIAKRLGGTGSVPALPMLLIDTDAKSLGQVTRCGEEEPGLNASETLALPLKRPQDYREKSDQLLKWLGRRWLYNIPRSLKTEGIRPLGRLALVDNARRAFQRIRRSMSEAASEASRQETQAETGVEFGEGLRVYVVASVSGGTGGGMTLDVAYAVRSIIARLGIEDPRIIGVLTHSTSREPTRDELARVNAYSWLSELRQYETGATGYPGDASCGLPAHEPGTPAFDATYLTSLGRRLDAPDFEAAVDRIADYLSADALTSVQPILDACRDADAGADGPRSCLRSFSTIRDDSADREALDETELTIIRNLVAGWLGSRGAADPSQGDRRTAPVLPGAVAFVAGAHLDPAPLATNCRALLEASLGSDAGAFFESRVHGVDTATLDEALRDIEGVFQCDELADASVDGARLAKLVAPLADRTHQQIAHWVLERLNEPSERLDGARRAYRWCMDHLTAIRRDIERIRDAIEGEHRKARAALVEDESGPAKQALRKYFRLRLDHGALTAALLVVDRLETLCRDLPGHLEQIRGLLAEIGERFPIDGDGPTSSTATEDPEELSRLVSLLDKRLHEEFLSENGGLLKAISTGEAIEELVKTLDHATRRLTRTSRSPLAARDDRDEDSIRTAGLPELFDSGGRYRQVALVPAGQERLPEEFDAALEGVRRIEDARSELLLITEVDGVSLPHVAAGLIERRRDYAAFSERSRTRRDVPWADPTEEAPRGVAPLATAMVTSLQPDGSVPLGL